MENDPVRGGGQSMTATKERARAAAEALTAAMESEMGPEAGAKYRRDLMAVAVRAANDEAVRTYWRRGSDALDAGGDYH